MPSCVATPLGNLSLRWLSRIVESEWVLLDNKEQTYLLSLANMEYGVWVCVLEQLGKDAWQVDLKSGLHMIHLDNMNLSNFDVVPCKSRSPATTRMKHIIYVQCGEVCTTKNSKNKKKREKKGLPCVGICHEELNECA